MDTIKLPEIPDFKNGVKTTEFYVTLLSYVLSALVIFGVVSNDQAKQLLDSIGDLSVAIITLGTALGPIVTTVVYIYSRMKAKEDATTTALAAIELKTEKK